MTTSAFTATSGAEDELPVEVILSYGAAAGGVADIKGDKTAAVRARLLGPDVMLVWADVLARPFLFPPKPTSRAVLSTARP